MDTSAQFAALYHTHHSLEPEDMPFWLELARKQGGPALELGCGSGRVTLALAQAGMEVCGLDHDFQMLRYLRTRIPVELMDKVRIFQADMGAFRMAQRFALILMPCNTLSSLDDATRGRTFHNVAAHLQPGGIFAASLPNPAVLKSMPRRGEEEIEETFQHPHTGNPVQVSSAWKRTDAEFILTWHYDHLLPDGEVRRFSATTRHKLQSLEEYEVELRQAGLSLRSVWGDFDGQPYSEETPNLIWLAKGKRG
jgi:SAM-dependent methyltransferase